MKGVGFSKRGTFHRESGPAHDPTRPHLHIICTNENQYGLMLVVALCSLEPYTADRTCLLGIGDHPYITRRSFINYAKAEILERTTLQEALRRGAIEPDADFDGKLFDLVCEGLRTSKWVRPKVAAYYSSSSNQGSAAA